MLWFIKKKAPGIHYFVLDPRAALCPPYSFTTLKAFRKYLLFFLVGLVHHTETEYPLNKMSILHIQPLTHLLQEKYIYMLCLLYLPISLFALGNGLSESNFIL